MNEPASQYVPKPSAVSTGELIDSEKYQEITKHSKHYYDYDRNGRLNQVKMNKDEEELTAIERQEMIEKLEVLKTNNFQAVAIACMAEYSRVYGMMPEDESWMFMEAEYYATGEGQTVCLQMTQANPGHKDDFDRSLPYPNNYHQLTTPAYRAVRNFHKNFGTWYLHGLRFHTREAFFTKYANQLPASLLKLKDQQCFLEYHSELHYNFS